MYCPRARPSSSRPTSSFLSVAVFSSQSVTMVVTRYALIALLSAGAAVASPLHGRSSAYAVKETHAIPRRWTVVSAAPADHVIKLDIALAQGQFDELHRHLYEGV